MQSSYVYTLMKMQRRLLCRWHMLALGTVQRSNFTCAAPNSYLYRPKLLSSTVDLDSQTFHLHISSCNIYNRHIRKLLTKN